MNTPELFILGAIVTAIVAVALGLVLYGAIMDGRNPSGEAGEDAEAAPGESAGPEPAETPALTR